MTKKDSANPSRDFDTAAVGDIGGAFGGADFGEEAERLGRTRGRIHSYETLGALDGPGLRTVVFFQGCPLRCLYCHNPDTFDPSAGRLVTAREVTAFVSRYKNYFGREGGVTLSGGEPLLQEAFCYDLMRLMRLEGIGVALDTAGSVYSERCLDAADVVLLDIKHTDPTAFTALTGGKADNTLRTLDYLRSHGKRFWIRQVIVPGVTDGEDNVRALKALSRGAERVELLPYHTMGRVKWERLGLKYALDGIDPPDGETMTKLKKILEGD